MDLRQLDALVAVADHRTFSAAARALHTVQSNVSTHVARLEKELGVVLVDRAGNRLTAEGEVVLARARRVASELQALVSDIASVREDVSGNVRLGTIGTAGRWMTPALLTALGERYPRVDLVVVEATTTGLLPQLAIGQIDLAVVNQPLRDPEFRVDPLFEEALVLVAPAHHPLADDDGPVTVAQVAVHEILLAPPGNAVRDLLDNEARAQGVELVPAGVLDGVRLLASLAFDGVGPAIVPASAIPRWLRGPFKIRAIDGVPHRHVGVAWRRRGLPSQAAERVEQVLRAVVMTEGRLHPGITPTAAG
jgi:DNA-binding transcriptional LysR family regulator